MILKLPTTKKHTFPVSFSREKVSNMSAVEMQIVSTNRLTGFNIKEAFVINGLS